MKRTDLSNQGNIYDSATIRSYSTRSLREDEFHRRAQELGCGLGSNISWVNVPAVVPTDELEDVEDKVEFTPWPILLPSSTAPGCISVAMFW